MCAYHNIIRYRHIANNITTRIHAHIIADVWYHAIPLFPSILLTYCTILEDGEVLTDDGVGQHNTCRGIYSQSPTYLAFRTDKYSILMN